MDLASQLVTGDVREVRATFAKKGATGPELVWSPTADDLKPSELRFLLAHWMALKGARPLPQSTDIDALELGPVLGYVALVDVLDAGADFRYRLFGSKVAFVSGFDVTGQLVSQHPASPYIVEFTLAGYRAALRRGEPMATIHSPPPAVSTTIWHRLVLPLAADTGAIGRFLVGNVPVARSGDTIRGG
jgi:hypothetical protein